MLDPDNRHLLLDALRPPAGMTFDYAVGTTFSLDLEALLLAPISFALFDARAAETGDPKRSDPLAVIEAVRRHADNIDLFCQAGQIAIPPRDQPVFALLEDSVHPTSSPAPGHIFHPKVWCLRFNDKSEHAYRVLVLSRNLTFDRSWDTIAVIDGRPSKATRHLAELNRPIADFIESLPPLANRDLPIERYNRVAELADQLLDVEWELPRRVNTLKFLPSGINGYESSAPRRADRALVISPFITSVQLEKLVESGRRTTLISRPESLDHIDMNVLDQFENVFVLDPATEEGAAEGPESDLSGIREEIAERPGANLTGIHAKVMVSDQGWDAEFRTGSTNATTAGWGGNVEFDIALTGPKGVYGVEQVLGVDAKNSLSSMLLPYRRTERDALPESPAEKMTYRLEQLGREIAGLALLVRVEGDADHFRMILTSDRPLPQADGATIRCWPISRHPDTATPQLNGHPVHCSQGGLSLQSLTSFFVFELEADTEDGPVVVRIVTNARMVGAPEDRSERLLLEQLKTKGDVLRYLLFLLADLGDDSALELASVLTSAPGEASREWMPQVPLYESMVQALARNPEALLPIDRLIRDLQRTEDGRDLLPDGIEDIWPAIWEARSQLI